MIFIIFFNSQNNKGGKRIKNLQRRKGRGTSCSSVFCRAFFFTCYSMAKVLKYYEALIIQSDFFNARRCHRGTAVVTKVEPKGEERPQLPPLDRPALHHCRNRGGCE